MSSPPANVRPDLNETYIDNRAAWSAWRRRNYGFFAEALREVPQGSRIVDAGAGPGFFRDLVERYRYIAVDFYPYPGVRIVSDVVTDPLPIRSQTVDVVVLSNVLEHLCCPERTLRDCSRILKPAGRLLITVPFLFKLHQQPHDYYRYTEYKLVEMLEEAGLELLDCRRIGNVMEHLGSIRWEIRRLASESTRHKWLLRHVCRLDDYITNTLIRVGRLNDSVLANSDYFVGYGCIAQKPT